MKRISDPRLRAIWNAAPRDSKGVIDGVRTILVYRRGAGTCAVPLDALTEEEIQDKLPRHMKGVAHEA